MNTTPLSTEQAAELDILLNLSPLDILQGFIERMMVLILHIAFTFLILLSVLRVRKTFLIAAMGWHAGLNAVVVVLAQTLGIWPTEAFFRGECTRRSIRHPCSVECDSGWGRREYNPQGYRGSMNPGTAFLP